MPEAQENYKLDFPIHKHISVRLHSNSSSRITKHSRCCMLPTSPLPAACTARPACPTHRHSTSSLSGSWVHLSLGPNTAGSWTLSITQSWMAYSTQAANSKKSSNGTASALFAMFSRAFCPFFFVLVFFCFCFLFSSQVPLLLTGSKAFDPSLSHFMG